MNIEFWDIERIRAYENNPRLIPPKAIRKVAASIREFGWQQPICVEPDGTIIVGHTRFRAAVDELGLRQVPVVVATGLTPEQIRAYRVADNRTNQESTWDFDLLKNELLDLKGSIDLGLTGFDSRELAFLEPVDRLELAPPVPKNPTTRAGDIYELGPHRVLCGDATSAEAVARLLGASKPRLMVTDPPYGIELDSEWRDRAGINKHGPAQASYMKHRIEGHTETSISGDTIADWSHAFELVPSLQVSYVWHASRFTSEVLRGLLRIGFLHHQQIIWRKTQAALTRTHYWFQHEPCWYVRKKRAPWFGKPGENTTIWDAASPKAIMGGSDEEKFDHPCQKPVELMRRPILNHTAEDEAVYDPFLGSGTTLMAAQVTGRACYGLELDPGYCDVIVTRWEQFTGKQATLEADGRTFARVKAECVGAEA